MIGKLTRERQIEIGFITVYSILIFAIFYTLISMNGVILGNDPAVHLQKAQIFLQTGKISLSGSDWMPPLFEIVLAMFISFSGAATVGQLIFLVKAFAVIGDWLLFLSVYLIASKFFNKKVGAVAAVFLSMCFPLYELNAWGGYTTVLGIAFLLLVLLYLPLAVEKAGYLPVTFLVGFGLVLSHQLAAFLAVIMLAPLVPFMLIKSRGKHLKVLIALFLGGGVAFAIYYLPAMLPYLGMILNILFYLQKSYAYQIPATNFASFINNFGFIFFLTLSGIVTAYYLLIRVNKKPIFYLTLLLSFFVPLFFAESYVIGLYMPFQWFNYYLTPPIAILAAVSVVFAAEKFWAYYSKRRLLPHLAPINALRKNWLKIATVSLIMVMAVVLVARSDEVYESILQASMFYSTTDTKAYDAGVWLNQNYPDNATAVVTRVPGSWFSTFANKTVIAQTNAAEGSNDVADSVLSLSYELQGAQTMLNVYEAKGDIADEIYVPINQILFRVTYMSTDGDFLSFNQNNSYHYYPLSTLNRQISFNNNSYPAEISLIYSNQYVSLKQTMVVQNDSYPINVSWALSPVKNDISNVTLYLTNSFDLQFQFDKVQIPQLMDWVNPWDVLSKSTYGNEWAVVSFTNTSLTDHYIGLYDDKDQLGYAFNFTDLPDWGNVGALGGGRAIDAVRFQYQFNEINVNQTVTRHYQVLALSKNSFPQLQPNTLQSLFSYQPSQFAVFTSDFKDYIAKYNIEFIIYDKNELTSNMAGCKFLQQIYSNDRYIIFKIMSNYNQTVT